MKIKLSKNLLVEDEIISRKTLNSFLLPLGEVDIAIIGKEAVGAVKKNPLKQGALWIDIFRCHDA